MDPRGDDEPDRGEPDEQALVRELRRITDEAAAADGDDPEAWQAWRARAIQVRRQLRALRARAAPSPSPPASSWAGGLG